MYPDRQEILTLPDMTQALFLFGLPSTLWQNRHRWPAPLSRQIAQLTISKNSHFIACFSAKSGFVVPSKPLGHLAVLNSANDRILLCHVLAVDNGKGYYQLTYGGPTLIDRRGLVWAMDKLRARAKR